MRAGPAAPLSGGSIVALLAAIPALAILLLGAPGVHALALRPAWAAACLRTMLLAEISVAFAWPAGVLAAFGLWQAGRGMRRIVFGMAILCLLLPQRVVAQGLAAWPRTHLAALVAVHVSASACLVLLVMSATLNRISPALLAASANAGVPALRAWRLVMLPLLGWPLAVSAAAAAAYAMSGSVLDAALAARGHATLGAMSATDTLTGATELAPAALMLAAVCLLPLLVLGLADALRRRPGGSVQLSQNCSASSDLNDMRTASASISSTSETGT